MEQSVRVGHYHSAVTRAGNRFIKIRLTEEKVTNRYNKWDYYNIYNLRKLITQV